MIPLAEAQQRLLALVSPLPVVHAPFPQAAGRWLAEPIIARRTQPARPLSAMDGYAVTHASGAGPWRVIGESAAGRAFSGIVAPMEAIRIFTGAVVPPQCDTIIIQENVTLDGDIITLHPAIDTVKSAHIRASGSDFRVGDIVLGAGEMVSPAAIGLAAMAGYATLAVRDRPRVAILSTGGELTAIGHETKDQQIPSSNAPMLSAMLAEIGADIQDLGIVPDDLDALIAAIAGVKADILVTIGGASVGDHDLVRPALAACGAKLDFWKVAMRPGKPVMAGHLADGIVIGLPGNPVSAYVTALLFLLPAVRALGGARNCLPKTGQATLSGAIPASGSRTDHIRARIENGVIAPIGINDSAALRSLAGSNALIVRAAGAEAAQDGEVVAYISYP